ncbi:MAG: hypothetical protein HYR57_02190 [Candidatus Koribacter versatilis]|nr:hypothetical protein [Candidatus Koribacter versatilis]
MKVDMGSVRVEGGSQPGVSYVIHSRAYTSSEQQARREFDAYKISATSKGDTVWIVGDWQGGRSRKFSGDFVISVPRNLELAKIETEGGNVRTTGIAGRTEIQSGGGSIHLDDIGGAINGETGGGAIDVGTVGSDVNVRTGGGNIKVASAKGKLAAESGGGSVVVLSCLQGATLETGGGNIQVERCQGTVRATTGGGSIDLGDIGGPVEIETGGGSIRLSSAKGAVKAETGGGCIELNGVPSARAETGGGGIIARFLPSAGERTDSTLETGAGDITVYLASDLPISIRAAIELANGHTIRTDFSDIHIASEGGDWGPRTVTAEGKLNGGGPVLKVRTNSGNIKFLRVSH